MQQVTGGLSGIYNDGNDVLLWGDGSMDKAIYTVMKYVENPKYEASDEELKNMANIAMTHGGLAVLNNAVIRGYIYAQGGFFRGKVETSVNGKRIVIDPYKNAIQMFDASDNMIYDLSFFKMDSMTVPKMTVKGYMGKTEMYVCEYSANGISGTIGTSKYVLDGNGITLSNTLEGYTGEIRISVNANGKQSSGQAIYPTNKKPPLMGNSTVTATDS